MWLLIKYGIEFFVGGIFVVLSVLVVILLFYFIFVISVCSCGGKWVVM